MPTPIGLALVGVGKIATDQHVPALQEAGGFALRAVVSRSGRTIDGVDTHRTVADLLDRASGVDALAFCNPADGRRDDVARALRAGRHVLLEKPPVASLAEFAPLAALAARNAETDGADGAGDDRPTLFTAWHSRFGLAVEPARALLARTALRTVTVEWREDVRHWHPGQDWLWTPAGLGVFDPGVNALSILTRVLPRPFALRRAVLDIPSNRAAPIAAALEFADTDGVPIRAALDFRHAEPRVWTIRLDTAEGSFALTEGGHRLVRADAPAEPAPFAGLSPHEYPNLYRHFAALIASGRSAADITPLLHASDALTLGERRVAAPFDH